MNNDRLRISSNLFGKLSSGEEIVVYKIRNSTNSSVEILNFGGIIVSINVPDKNGIIDDIALGMDSIEGYLKQNYYLGAIVGRYANRIADGKFSIGEEEFILPKNDNSNTLHGGNNGFDKKIWQVEPFEETDAAGLKLSLVSEDGEEGFPGRLDINVVYRFDDENNLSVHYKAFTNKTTVVNLTQHTYFNLDGHSAGSIKDHEMMIPAEYYIPINSSFIPTGKIETVVSSPLDFRVFKRIGDDIDCNHEQINLAGGYDHTWILSDTKQSCLNLAAKVYSEKSGRLLEVKTDQPGTQLYTGNFLNRTITGKKGTKYGSRDGFCLETQYFPNSPNQPDFPTTILRPNEEYNTKTIFSFSVIK